MGFFSFTVHRSTRVRGGNTRGNIETSRRIEEPRSTIWARMSMLNNSRKVCLIQETMHDNSSDQSAHIFENLKNTSPAIKIVDMPFHGLSSSHA